jgi:hypothetical protein
MGDTATPATGASAQSQQQVVESPEVVAARAKSSTAGFARNRAEATYNTLKKEKGEKSPEAQAAKQTLLTAQAEVEKAQAELREALKLPKSSAPVAKKTKAAPSRTPASKSTVAKNEAPVSKTPAPESEPPKAFFLERVILEHRSMEFIKMPDPQLKERIEKILEHKITPKNLEYYQKQLNGEQLHILEVPVRGEMAIRRASAYLMEVEVSAPKLEKR